MWLDHMDDVEISIAVAQECDKRREAQEDKGADPSLYAPWGKLSYGPDYVPRKCNPPRAD
jgi:hypothetical protein